MVLTKATRKAALDHIIDNVIEDDDGTIKKALVEEYGIRGPEDIVLIPSNHFDGLQYRDEEGDLQPLRKHFINLICSFVFFCEWVSRKVFSTQYHRGRGAFF